MTLNVYDGNFAGYLLYIAGQISRLAVSLRPHNGSIAGGSRISEMAGTSIISTDFRFLAGNHRKCVS